MMTVVNTVFRSQNQNFCIITTDITFDCRKLLLKDLNMDVEGGSSDEGDKDLDIDMEFAARKPLNTPDEVLEYWNNCFKKDKLTHLHFREWWRQKVPKIFSPVPSMNYQKPSDHIEEEDVQKYFFDLLER